jgi:UDP-glucose 4-epimerase
MKILVLGGNGFIGSHLVDKLLIEGNSVRVFDKNEEHFRPFLPNVEYHLGEFGNRGLLLEALEGIDIVVHLISTTLPKTSNDDPVFDVKSNIIETLFLLEQCVFKKIKKIIFTSSGGTVYGVPEIVPVKEIHPTNPICSYGICKLTIEKYLFLFKQLHGLDFTIIRPSNPYGSRQNPFGIQGAIPVFLGKISQNKPIQIWGNGGIVRDYIYIEDLVNAIYSSIINTTPSNIFNIGSGTGHSLNNLIAVMKMVTGRDVDVTYAKPRSYDVPEIFMDIGRAKDELNWKPAKSLEFGIQKTWEFINNLKY